MCGDVTSVFLKTIFNFTKIVRDSKPIVRKVIRNSEFHGGHTQTTAVATVGMLGKNCPCGLTVYISYYAW